MNTAVHIEPMPPTQRHPYVRWAVTQAGWGRPVARFCHAMREAALIAPKQVTR